MRANLIKIAAMGAVLSAAAISPASAAAVQFKWDPAGATTPLNGTSFTADNMTGTDFSTIQLTVTSATTAAFTDNGYLPITQFQLGGGVVTTTGLDAAGGYGLVFQFSAVGTQQAIGGNPIPPNPGVLLGSLSSLTFSLIGYTIPALGTPASFSFNAQNGVIASIPGTQVVLAQGSLLNGGVTLANFGSGLVPGASALSTFLPCVAAGGACTFDESAFFLLPPLTQLLDIFASFTNTPLQILSPVSCNGGLSQCIGIQGGSNSADLITAVPEPRSLALFGTGILALGMLLSRRRKLSS